MTKNSFRFFAVTILALFFASQNVCAAANQLSSADVGKFVEAIPDVEVFASDMKAQGKDKILEGAVKPVDGEKEFSPYSKGVELLKEKFPEDYKHLGDIVTKHGFKSQESWAQAGDNVMLSYMAIKVEQQNPEVAQSLKNITPEMKAQMPPETQAQVDNAMKMMEIVNAVPPANKDAVKPHLKGIDEWLERSAASEPKQLPLKK